MNKNELKVIASAMVKEGKGILAADESTPTCTKRFEAIGVESTALNRNKYRDMLFTTEGMEEFISGVILFDETLHQSTIQENILFPKYFESKGVLTGIKVDAGAKDLALHNGEKITEGLDSLRERLLKYYDLGARFAKWRAVITIGTNIPSIACIHGNAAALARYAALCQESGLVPIVEPEVLMDGEHTIDKCFEVSRKTFYQVFEELEKQDIYLPGIVLKPNMIISGLNCTEQAPVEEVADKTVECLRETVPEEVPGCAFLSGGQTSEKATKHLNAMNKNYIDKLPWNLTFSYGRALQEKALMAWSGKEDNIKGAQRLFYNRAKFNSLATRGSYSENLEMETV